MYVYTYIYISGISIFISISIYISFYLQGCVGMWCAWRLGGTLWPLRSSLIQPASPMTYYRMKGSPTQSTRLCGCALQAEACMRLCAVHGCLCTMAQIETGFKQVGLNQTLAHPMTDAHQKGLACPNMFWHVFGVCEPNQLPVVHPCTASEEQRLNGALKRVAAGEENAQGL